MCTMSQLATNTGVMSSSTTLSAKYSAKQCHVINLNLTDAGTLLSKKLHLAKSAAQVSTRRSMPPVEIDVGNIIDVEAEVTRAESDKSKNDLVKEDTHEKGDKSKGLLNFQSTLRTYCLSDCDYISRQKKQRLKNFNAKIRHSIRNRMKKRHKDFKYLHNLERYRTTVEDSDEAGHDDEMTEETLDKSKSAMQETKEVFKTPERSKTVGPSEKREPIKPELSRPKLTPYTSPYAEPFKSIVVKESALMSQKYSIKISQATKQDSDSLNNSSQNKSAPLLFKQQTLGGHTIETKFIESNSTPPPAVPNQLNIMSITEQPDAHQFKNPPPETFLNKSATIASYNNSSEPPSSQKHSNNVNTLRLRSLSNVECEQKPDKKLEHKQQQAKEFTTDYEIFEHLLVNELDERSITESIHLKNSISQLKIDFEKQLEAKKCLIQNLNLTGNKLTSAKTTSNAVGRHRSSEARNFEDLNINNTKIVLNSKKSSMVAKVGAAEATKQQRSNGSESGSDKGAKTVSKPATGNTASKQTDHAKNLSTRRKLIFKRNFSDESDTETRPKNQSSSKSGINVESSEQPQGKSENPGESQGLESASDTGKAANAQDFNNESIHRVYEKTKILIRNFYKNFDLMNENQQKLESQIAIEQIGSDGIGNAGSRMNSVNLQQNRGNPNFNSILTNTPYTPHWFNIATMGSNPAISAKKSAKSAKNSNRTKDTREKEDAPSMIKTEKTDGSISSSVYLYRKSLQNGQNNLLHETKDGKVVLNSYRGYRLNKREDSNIIDMSTLDESQLPNKSRSPIRTTNDPLTKSSPPNQSLLNREKQKLIALNDAQKCDLASESVLLAQPSEQIDSEDTSEYIKFPDLNLKKQKAETSPTLSEEAADQVTQKNVIVPLNQVQAAPSQQHQSRQQQFTGRPAAGMLTGQNYVLAQMSKYQRNNSMNLLNLSTSKLLVNQGSCHNNNFMSSGVIKPKAAMLKQKENCEVEVATKHANQILCRGNTLIAKELSQHVMNQQQKIKTLDNQPSAAMHHQTPQVSLNASKVKLSQIQAKPKSSHSLYGQHNKISENTNLINSNPDITLSSATSRSTITSERQHTPKHYVQQEIEKPVLVKPVEPEPMFSAEIFKASEAEKIVKMEKIQEMKKMTVLEEPPLTKPQGLYTYAVTSSCQLRENFYNNRSLINTSSNSTNQLIYHRSETMLNGEDLKEESDRASLMDNEPMTPIETKNTKKNRRLFKDLEFIYNEQQVFKLSRQIWFQIRTNKYRTNQNRLNENHLNQYLDQLNNSSMLINKLYNYDVYKFYERAKIALLIKCLTPLKSNFNKNVEPTSINHIIKNINNIATIAEKNAQANNSDYNNKSQYHIDKDLMVKRDGTNVSSASVEDNKVDEEDEEDEEDDENEDKEDEFYAEFEKQNNEGIDDDKIYEEEEDEDGQKNVHMTS